MSGWAGFSEEELRKMQQKDSAGSAAAARGRKPVPANRSRQQIQREKALQLAAQKNAGAASLCLPPEQQLTKPPPEEEPKGAAPPAGAPAVKQEVQEKAIEMKTAPEKETPAVKELEKQEVALREQTRLEQLQQEQKTMEEKNKRKKALLTKTIAEKSKQTQAEAVKLKRIQKELQALDDMVSNDIGILRGKIEQASWEYSAARKRYEKAEAEYVTSKLDLHKKTEVKEQLTEHLCAIIQQNELRKAHKLEELMQQLQLHATEEERGGCAETQRNGPAESGEGTEQSSKDCRPTEEETAKEENGGGGVLQEPRPMTEPPKTEPNCKTLENCVQSEIMAS
ncbi:RAB6-interacting golgin [Sander vitreus]